MQDYLSTQPTRHCYTKEQQYHPLSLINFGNTTTQTFHKLLLGTSLSPISFVHYQKHICTFMFRIVNIILLALIKISVTYVYTFYVLGTERDYRDRVPSVCGEDAEMQDTYNHQGYHPALHHSPAHKGMPGTAEVTSSMPDGTMNPVKPVKRSPGRPRKNPDGNPKPPAVRGRKPGQSKLSLMFMKISYLVRHFISMPCALHDRVMPQQ